MNCECGRSLVSGYDECWQGEPYPPNWEVEAYPHYSLGGSHGWRDFTSITLESEKILTICDNGFIVWAIPARKLKGIIRHKEWRAEL